MKLPPTFMGYDGKTELERIENESPSKKNIADKVNPIIPISGDLSFVTDENFYNEICKYIKKELPKLNNVLKFNDSVMKQSNSYLAVAVDMYLKSINSEYRIATQLDLEQNLNFTKDTYNDSGLALRNLTGTNKEQAKYIFDQLKKRNVSESNFPLWINLRDLVLDNNLNFNLTEESFYKTAECLNWESGTSFSKVNSFGVPKEKDKSSSRQIWTNKDYALSRCYLDRYSYLGSGDSILSISSDGGRVVLAKPRSG